MLGVEAVDQTIEKAPPRRRALDEEAIHLRGQPYEVDMLGEDGLAARGRAVDAHDAALAAARRGFASGADLHGVARSRDIRRDRPRHYP